MTEGPPSLLDPELLADPYPFFSWLRREAPVHEVGATRVFTVASFSLVEQALEAVDDYSANLTGLLVRDEGGAPAVFELGGVGDANAVLATADPPPHDVHRRLVQPVLAAGRVAELEAWLRERVRRRLAPFVAAGGGDFAAALGDPVPSEAISRLLGFPAADLPRILGFAMQGGAMLAGTLSRAELTALARDTLHLASYLTAHLAAAKGDSALRQSAPALDALLAGSERGEISEGQALGIAVVLVGAGGESTASLLGNAVHTLAQRPDLQQLLRAEPARIPAFVEESVRLESPFRGHYRVVRRPTALGGVPLAPGDRLFLLWASANRDAARFARPDEIDLARPHPRDHLGFGRGIHFCVGAPLARLEARVLVEELLAGTCAVALDPGRPARRVPSLFVRRFAELPVRVAA